jgi:integrase/recombinase XerD
LRVLIDSASSPRDRCIVQLLSETGIRRGELAALDVADLVGDQTLLVVRRGKGGKMRMLPLTPSMKRCLMSLQGSRSSGPFFISRAGLRLSVRQINRIVAETGKRAGVANPNPRHNQITCHLLRHSFARLWKDAGGSIETLSKILGHSSVKTTMDVYGTESLVDVRRNYERMMAKPSGPFGKAGRGSSRSDP